MKECTIADAVNLANTALEKAFSLRFFESTFVIKHDEIIFVRKYHIKKAINIDCCKNFIK